MQKVQKTYTQEFKREAVRLAQTSGKSIAQIARELGISDSSVHQWRKELAEHGSEAFPGSGHQTALEEENRRLKRELERTRQERDILKKTVSIFSHGQLWGTKSWKTLEKTILPVCASRWEVDRRYYRGVDRMKDGSRLSVVLDLFSRRVIWWAMAAIQDETLIETALRMALLGRHPSAGMLFHSDRGSQYTSDAYRAVLAEVGVTVSMGRTGKWYENAVTESFFGTLKGECVERACFQTRGQARQTIFEYVECFYNRVRRHSSLGYVSPVAYEQSMC
jgi:transposase InsO family protein